MINKRIIKITLLSAILVASTINAQEFYTCVPKKSWWIGMMREGTAKWKKVIDLQITSPLKDFKGFLEAGKYKVKAAGAGGKEELREFTLTKTHEYIACVGASGGGGGAGGFHYLGGGGGGGGGKGYFGYYGGGGGGHGGLGGKPGVAGKGGNENRRGGNGGFGGSGGGGYGGGGAGGSGGSTGGDGGFGTGDDGQNYCKSDCLGITGNSSEDKDVGGSGSGRYRTGCVVGYGGYKGGGGRGGCGCMGGGGGGGGYGDGPGGGGGGGGSYFKVADIDMLLQGGDGKRASNDNGGHGAGPDGYVIVEKME